MKKYCNIELLRLPKNKNKIQQKQFDGKSFIYIFSCDVINNSVKVGGGNVTVDNGGEIIISDVKF